MIPVDGNRSIVATSTSKPWRATIAVSSARDNSGKGASPLAVHTNSLVRTANSVLEIDGRDRAHAAGVEVVDRLDDLLAGVHHERSVVCDRLTDREPAEEEHLEGG